MHWDHVGTCALRVLSSCFSAQQTSNQELRNPYHLSLFQVLSHPWSSIFSSGVEALAKIQGWVGSLDCMSAVSLCFDFRARHLLPKGMNNVFDWVINTARPWRNKLFPAGWWMFLEWLAAGPSSPRPGAFSWLESNSRLAHSPILASRVGSHGGTGYLSSSFFQLWGN